MKALMRRLIQSIASAVLSYGPVAALITWVGWDVTPAQVTMTVLPVVMLIYTQIGDALQRSTIVRENPLLTWVVGLLMGGVSTPSYGPADG